MLEQEGHPMNAEQHSMAAARSNDNNHEAMPPLHTTEQHDQLVSLQNLIKLHFSDLSCATAVSASGSPILTIWQQPNNQSTKGLLMRDLPLFYIIGSVNDNLRLSMRLTTFHGKIVSELTDDAHSPLEENTKISFVDRLTHIQLCQGVKVLDPTLRLDPQTFTFLYLVEYLDQSVIVRSRQCQFALHDGTLVCEVCEALNETATNKKPMVGPDGEIFPISGLGSFSGMAGDSNEDVKPLLLPQVSFNEDLDADDIKGGDAIIDDEYWSSNGGQDSEDPEWNECSNLSEKKSKKLKRSKVMKGRKRSANETEILFTCTQCDCGAFETRKLLKHHIHDAHDGVGLEILALKCAEPECIFEAATQKLLNEHRRDAHGIAPSFKCRYCNNFETNTRKRLSKHVATEHASKKGTRPFGCKRCPSTWFRLKSELRRHVAAAHYDGPYKCDQCPFEATKRWRLHEHVRFVHDKIKPFLCDQCSQPFARRERLVRHIKAVHDKIRDYKCPHTGCPYEAARSSQLKIHITSVHDKLKPFLCEHCSYEGPTKSDITRHVKHVHATIKPFKCQHCPYETTANPGLLKHIQTVHAGIKPYKCPHCTYECAMKQQLTLHIRAIHEKVRPFTCDLCSFAAARKQEVVRHRTAVHDPSKHFVCHYCPYKSPRRHIVTQHIRKSHDRNYTPPNKKIGRRLAPDPRSQPGLTSAWQNQTEKDRHNLSGILAEDKKAEAAELMGASPQQLNNQSQVTISQTHAAAAGLAVPGEYHGIKVEHMPNY